MESMSDDLKEMDDWKPMSEDYESISFNSYGSDQIGAHLPYYLLPQSKDKHNKSTQNISLFLDGFPPELTENGLKNFLQRIGCQSIVDLKIYRDCNESAKIGRPFGVVDFGSSKAAKNSVELIKSQKFYKIFVCFTATDSENAEKFLKIDEEFQRFREQLMKQTQEMRENGELEPLSTTHYYLSSYRFKGI